MHLNKSLIAALLSLGPVSYTHLDVYKRQGLRSLRDLTQHLTTRADDSHAAPVSEFPKAPIHLWKVLWMSRVGTVSYTHLFIG